MKFCQDFEAEFWLRFWSWSFVEILRLNLGQDFEAEFDQDFEAEVLKILGQSRPTAGKA